MEVPYSLHKRRSPLRTDAFLLFTHDPSTVLTAVARFGGWPEIYAIKGGYLFIPTEVKESLAGAVRLRRLAGSLFIPIDADLRPSLLPEEIIDLTRDQGLVVLPNVVFLAFDVHRALEVSHFLTPPKVLRSAAKAFPETPQLAEHLIEIRVETSQPMAEILLAGQPDSADPLSREPNDKVPESARPPGGSFLENLQAGMMLGLGQMMNFLGRNLNLPGMTSLGSNFARSAFEAVPRLTEKILGQQEGALREVLRQLERGNIEDALRRAPPAFADPDAPMGRVDTGSNLGFRNTNYSLSQLLGTGGSAGSVWLGGGDVWALLAAQYRKLGEDAVARGDFRRAAYIYGVLLRDPRRAAQVLSQGGLHRDAAILYQDKLKDPINAAREFEKAGLYDDALRHYLALEHFETAGDIYRKLGEESEAEALYHREAEQLAKNKRHRAAGDLVTAKTGNFALAQGYFQTGWETRGPEQLACAERLLETHSGHARWEDVKVLVEEAELRFGPPNVEEASRFYETLFRHETAMPADVKDDLRDQARLALAEHLQFHAQSHATPGNIIAKTFGSRAKWSASTVRDAAVALKAELRSGSPKAVVAKTPELETLCVGNIKSVMSTVGMGYLGILTERGEVIIYRGSRDGLTRVNVDGNDGLNLVAIAADENARVVCSINREDQQHYRISAYHRTGLATYKFSNSRRLHYDSEPLFCHSVNWKSRVSDYVISVLHVNNYMQYQGSNFQEIKKQLIEYQSDQLTWCFHADVYHYFWQDNEAFFTLNLIANSKVPTTYSHIVRMPWNPQPIPFQNHGKVSFLNPSVGIIELAGVDDAGVLNWSRIELRDEKLHAVHARAVHASGFAVAFLLEPGQLIAVTKDLVVLRFQANATSELQPRGPLAYLKHTAKPIHVGRVTGYAEILVVFEDGKMARVPLA